MNKAIHIERLRRDPIYVIMGEELSLGRKNAEMAELLVDAGVHIIQYREKHKSYQEKYAECMAIRTITEENDITFIVNDEPELAVACRADGIHVGQKDMPVGEVRQLVGPDMVIGLSTNTIEELKKAAAEGNADYVGLGPVFPTHSKNDANEVLTKATIKFAMQDYPLPVIAIGGINRSNLGALQHMGFRSFAMISAIVSQRNVSQAVGELRQVLVDQTVIL